MASSKGPHKGNLTFVDLPLETQEAVFSHVNGKDLHSLLRVSRHFFSLASAEIYRDLDFSFTTSEASDHNAMSSRLADALQTIIASEHDYAQYIKSFRYGISEANSHNALLMARVLWDPSADPCKILNTAMLLMVKQTAILESFHWDIPVELNGAVYQALHKIISLRDLRIRLDIQASMKTVVHHTSLPPNHPSNTVPPSIQLAPPHTFPLGTSHNNHLPAKSLGQRITNPTRHDYWSNGRVFSRFKNLTTLTLLGISDLDCLAEIAGCLKSSSASLKSLALSISQDLALKSRKRSAPNLTVDEQSESDPDEDEDILDASQQPTTTKKQQVNEADIRREKIAQEAILARIFDLQDVAAEGRKLEKNLALSAKSGAFEDPDLFTQDAKIIMRELAGCYKHLGGSEDNDRRREFLELTVKAAERYLNTHPKKDKKPVKEPSKPAAPTSTLPSLPSLSVPPGFDIGDFGIPGSASASSPAHWFLGGNLPSTSSMTTSGLSVAGKPLNPGGTLVSDSYTPPSQGYPLGSTGSYPISHSAQPVCPPVYGALSGPPKISSFNKGSYHHPLIKKSGLSSMLSHHQSISNGSTSKDSWNNMFSTPDGTNAEGQENIDPFQVVYEVDSEEVSSNGQGTPSSNKPALFPASNVTEEIQFDSMDIDMEHPDEDAIETGADQETIAESEEDLVSPRKRAKFEVAEPASPAPSVFQTGVLDRSSMIQDNNPSNSIEKSPDEAMQDYIRSTHGLQLEEFRLFLIPLKGSIVAKGLDLNVLKSLTLLNVGSQDSFWLLLTRLQNRSIQVSLRSIHTDDVSFAFLELLKTFEGLTELFLHERSTKHEIDQTIIARTTVDITGIRKKGLRKHIKTLKRLMIRNENDDAWDLDPKIIALLSGQGGALQELAVSMSMENYHIFMQNVAAFSNLVALHLLALRDNNRTFLHADSLHSAVDSFSHYPDVKLKWIALDNNLRLVSRKPERWVKVFEKWKEDKKRRAHIKSKGKGKAKATEGADSEDSSEAEMPGDEVGHRLIAMRLRADSRRNFSDAQGVEIFTKEIRLGKF